MNRAGVYILAGSCGGLLGLLAIAMPPRAATAEDAAAAEGGYGAITGQFVLEGDVPERKVLVEKGSPKVNDPAICAAEEILSDALLIDAKTKGIANVFIYLPKAEKMHPRLKSSTTKEVVFDQKGCRFIPHSLFVRTDQIVVVKSDDACNHNTKINTIRNQGVNFALGPNHRAGEPVKIKASEKRPVKVECNFHNWMRAYWLILDHPYGAISDAQGHFTIADLPAGEHALWVWHESGGDIEKKYKVMVIAGQTTEIGVIPIPLAKFTDTKN